MPRVYYGPFWPWPGLNVRTLRGPQMPAFEFLCIAERDGSLVYNVMPNGRAPISGASNQRVVTVVLKKQ